MSAGVGAANARAGKNAARVSARVEGIASVCCIETGWKEGGNLNGNRRAGDCGWRESLKERNLSRLIYNDNSEA